MTQHSYHAEYLQDRIQLKVDLVVPEFAIENDYTLWAFALGQKNWSVNRISGLDSIEGQDLIFIQSFLHTSQLLCELGRLPVFDVPRVVSVSQDMQKTKKYRLEIELVLIHFVPQSVYKILLKSSLELCQWMAQNHSTPENKNRIFHAITDQVIKKLHQQVPAGKSTIPVLREAHALGIPYLHLGMAVYQVGWGSKARRLDRSTCELDSAIGSKLAQNKVSTANILRMAGLPHPVHGVVKSENDALTIATKLGFPVVMKPTDRDRGEGVTVDICDEEGIKAAFAHAQKVSNSKQVIVERQVSGVCHRLFIANGRLLYAVKRHPISVFGDGKRPIKQLVDDAVVEQSNKATWDRSEIKPIDELALRALESQDLSLDSVPGKGCMIPLRRIESTEWGGVDEEVSTVIHPENLKVALQAAKLFGLHIAGIDIISPDITKPWYENGAIINEVNFSPLFGGGEISRSHISEFFANFIDGDGKIPVEFFDTESAATARQAHYLKESLRCYLVTAARTVDFSSNFVAMPFDDIKQRLKALIYRPDVDAIVVCMRSRGTHPA